MFANLTVRDNLMMGAYLRSDRAAIASDLEKVYTLFPRLKERINQLAGTLSGGEQQMLTIGRGLMSAPRIMLMDEPSLGLAPILVETIYEVIAEIRRRGTTILLVEQNAYKALAVADRAVLEQGCITRGRRSRPAPRRVYTSGLPWSEAREGRRRRQVRRRIVSARADMQIVTTPEIRIH